MHDVVFAIPLYGERTYDSVKNHLSNISYIRIHSTENNSKKDYLFFSNDRYTFMEDELYFFYEYFPVFKVGEGNVNLVDDEGNIHKYTMS